MTCQTSNKVTYKFLFCRLLDLLIIAQISNIFVAKAIRFNKILFTTINQKTTMNTNINPSS